MRLSMTPGRRQCPLFLPLFRRTARMGGWGPDCGGKKVHRVRLGRGDRTRLQPHEMGGQRLLVTLRLGGPADRRPLSLRRSHRRGRSWGPRRRLRRRALLGVRTARDFPALSREALTMHGPATAGPGIDRARVMDPALPRPVIREPPEGAPIKGRGRSVRRATARRTLKRPAA